MQVLSISSIQPDRHVILSLSYLCSKSPAHVSLLGHGGSGINIRIDMLSSLCRGRACFLSYFQRSVRKFACQVTASSFCAIPSFIFAICHCMLMVIFSDSVAELKTAPLKERFGRGKKIPSKSHRRVLKHCKKN